MPRKSKRRFKSKIGKKIENDVKKRQVMWLSRKGNRRDHDVASQAKDQRVSSGQARQSTRDSNIKHTNTMVKENLASSAWDSRETNGSSIKGNNTRRANTSCMYASLEKLSRDKGITYRKDGTIEADRQANATPQQIRQDPIMVNGKLDPLARNFSKSNQRLAPKSKSMRQPTNPSLERCKNRNGISIHPISLGPKKISDTSNNVDASRPTNLKAMPRLVRKTKDILRPKNQASKMMKKQRISIEANRDEKGEVLYRNPMGNEKNVISSSMEQQRSDTRANANKGTNDGDRKHLEVEDDDGDIHSEAIGSRPIKKQKIGIETNGDEEVDCGDQNLMEVEGSKINHRFCMGSTKSLDKEDYVSHDHEEATSSEILTCRIVKKRRRLVVTDDVDDEIEHNNVDHSTLDVEGNASRSTSQAALGTNGACKVLVPLVPECVKCQYCSNPIDEPIWRGIFKIDGKDYISLAGHLSTKSGDKVWKLSRLLMPVVQVTKLSRSKAWPKIWRKSKPCCDSIGLYFFSHEMRHDEDLEKLVKEIMDNDLVLQTFIGEPEMLIFPSSLLPERYKTFQGKHYLWGVFKPREDKYAVIAEPVNDAMPHAREEEKNKERASILHDEGGKASGSGCMVRQVHCKSPADSVQKIAAPRGVPDLPSIGSQPKAPEARQHGDATRHTVHGAEAAAVATNGSAVVREAVALATDTTAGPAEATPIDTNAATISENHGTTNSSIGVPPGRMFCFVAGQTPKLERLIQEMEREGSLVLAVRGDAIGAWPWPHNVASSKQQQQRA